MKSLADGTAMGLAALMLIAAPATAGDYFVLTKKGKVFKNNKKIDSGYGSRDIAAY